jgi:hypothetical protein
MWKGGNLKEDVMFGDLFCALGIYPVFVVLLYVVFNPVEIKVAVAQPSPFKCSLISNRNKHRFYLIPMHLPFESYSWQNIS